MKTFLNLEKDQKRLVVYFVALIVRFVLHWVSFATLILPIPCTNRTVCQPKKEACTMSSDGIQDL